tara:strand:- start:268 stop:1026 length:759 start_codon:yes stop_codon:yes gene_type:complete
MIEVLLLSLIQGITEFIPVSSSSHLILVSSFLNFENKSLSLDVSLHAGSFFAVITYFYKDILDFVNNRLLLFKILISSLPVMLIGFFLVNTGLIEIFRDIKIIGWTTIIFGVLLYFSDTFKTDRKLKNDFSIKSALFIGFLQVLSLIPGVSRSGITISAARMLNFERYDSAKISFLLSIPTLAAVSLFGLKNIISSDSFDFSVLNLIAIILSFLISFITIKFFIDYIKKFSLVVFVLYRIVIGVLILIFAYL